MIPGDVGLSKFPANELGILVWVFGIQETLAVSNRALQAPGMFYRHARLRFECTGCGACCTGKRDHVVETSVREREAIRTHLGLSRTWFRRRYLTRLDPDTLGIRLNPDGRCPFLGHDNRCRIYPVRPRQCRTYPWWPELVEHAKDWREEARRCEGMNRGNVVPLARIEHMLARERRRTSGK